MNNKQRTGGGDSLLIHIHPLKAIFFLHKTIEPRLKLPTILAAPSVNFGSARVLRARARLPGGPAEPLDTRGSRDAAGTIILITFIVRGDR